MEDKRISRLKIINIITIAVIIILSAILVINYVKGKRKQVIIDSNLQNRISANVSEDRTDMRVMDFLDSEYDKAVLRKHDYEEWADRLRNDKYTSVHLSTWNVDDSVGEWYEFYFGEGYEVVDYNFSTPEELSTFLNCISESGNEVNRVVIYMDPYGFYRNYMDSFILSSEQPLAFSQELRECLLDYIVDNPQISFSINLPVYDEKHWFDYTDKELGEVLSCWSDLIHYSGWGADVKVHALGLEKWVFDNPLCFGEYGMTDEVKKYLFALESTDKYLVEYDRADTLVEEFKTHVSAARRNRYTSKTAGDSTVVLLGDWMFLSGSLECFTIPEMIKGKLGCELINLSAASATVDGAEDKDSFANIVKSLPAELREKESDKLIFVIGYDLAGYLREKETPERDEALLAGIEALKENYEGSRVLLLSPELKGVKDEKIETLMDAETYIKVFPDGFNSDIWALYEVSDMITAGILD
ncbi:MAG: hypothetical protein K6E19_07580 [Lachnospiraceae bacterium]|nr:hypothetical protein [Lachnospiraceae bacterium]